MTTSTISYASGSVPLGGMGQWAGTSGGGAGQPSPLNLIRNGVGRYNSAYDFSYPCIGYNTTRPMVAFLQNAACVQGPASNYSSFMGYYTDTCTYQGAFTGPTTVTVYDSTFINLFTGPTTTLYGTTGAGGTGGLALAPGSTAGAPGSTGTPALTLAYQGFPTSRTSIFNYGYMYGGSGGGGGGGSVRWVVQNVYLGGGGGGGQPAGTGGQPNGLPGQSVGVGGQGLTQSITNPLPIFQGGPQARTVRSGSGGPAGGFGAAQGGNAGQGATVTPSSPAIPGLPLTAGGFGASASPAINNTAGGPANIVTYIVQGSHN